MKYFFFLSRGIAAMPRTISKGKRKIAVLPTHEQNIHLKNLPPLLIYRQTSESVVGIIGLQHFSFEQ